MCFCVAGRASLLGGGGRDFKCSNMFCLNIFFWESGSQMEFNSTVQPLKANQLANEIHAPCSFHSWQRDEIIDD